MILINKLIIKVQLVKKEKLLNIENKQNYLIKILFLINRKVQQNNFQKNNLLKNLEIVKKTILKQMNNIGKIKHLIGILNQLQQIKKSFIMKDFDKIKKQS